MVLEIVFVGQCEVFVCLDFIHFFPLGCKAHRSANRVSVLYEMSIFLTPTRLKPKLSLSNNLVLLILSCIDI